MATSSAFAAPVDFAREVQPIFEQNCVSCHGSAKQSSGLRLDRKADALRGGDSVNPLIKPGDAAGSPLLQIVAGLKPDLVMPPKGKRLSSEQIAVLRRWIEEGAVWPEDKSAAPDKKHWAFQPVTRPPVPPFSVPAGPMPRGTQRTVPHNAIDNFTAAKLKEKGLVLSPEADKRTLLRRLYFTLTGLPPEPQELARFVADRDARAYEKRVELLLDSPRYGERWARHWLDVVRFAESNGFEMNRPRGNAWPYRDYVIRAFNEDKSYDRFIIEQIAGDQLGTDAATCFLVGGAWDEVKSPDPVLTAQQRADELHDIVSTTGSAFLGLTVGCARCHTHKFDPIPHTDYYRFTASFAGVQHGERAMLPADFTDRLQKAAALRRQAAALDTQLEKFRPAARLGRRLLLDDNGRLNLTPSESSVAATPSVRAIESPTNKEAIEYSRGIERGQMNDPGDLARLPNLGLKYHYWDSVKGEHHDFFRWNPGLNGHFRIWLSWAVWTTHTPDARYVLDLDGNLITTNDQTEIAIVNQSQFADGTPAIAGQKRWSNFKFGGLHQLQPGSCIVLRGGDQGGPIVADALLLEEVADENSSPLPHLRAPVTRWANAESFAELEARFVRFSISAASSAEPCLDELEIFAADAPDGIPRNVALASVGAKATASGTLPGHAIHKLEHINDGRFGNRFSWISNEAGRGWIQIKLAGVERINRIVWSRDRDTDPLEGHFDDRLATGYTIEVSLDGQTWRKVAASVDRLPDEFRTRIVQFPALYGVADAEQAATARLVAQHAAAQSKARELEQRPAVYAGRFQQPEVTHRLDRGDPLQPKEPVAPGTLSAFGTAVELAVDAPEAERRLTLAKWIASPQNPLTARVMVNRLWHYNFGTGLLDTPSDFGLNGGKPTHPELLDWLASEFVSSGWSIKHMQRLMVTSATFRQSSKPNAKALAADADTRFLWRFPPRRIEAEALRDTILSVSGRLDLRMGGPGFELFEPNDNYVKVYKPKQSFGDETFRRMIYQNKPRLQLDDTFGSFDCPDAGQIAPRRNRSITPIQALGLLNSPFLVQQSDLMAARIEREVGHNPQAKVQRTFQLTLGREASPEEAKAALALIGEHGLSACCRALFNASEFMYVF